MYLNLLSDVHGRPQSNKAHGANRMQVIGVGTNWYLIAVVGCSFSELHGRHTVHETICAWAAQGADVCFSILFSTFDVSHQANITVVFFSRSEQEREKMWALTWLLPPDLLLNPEDLPQSKSAE